MSGKFIRLTDDFWVSPQITERDVEEAAKLGVKLIVNNRPDGEQLGQPKGAEIEAAAARHGVDYVAIPIGGMGVSAADIDKFDEAVGKVSGPVLAFCRSGTRSTILRALAKARAGAAPEDLLKEASWAGFNLSGIAPNLAALSRAGRD